MKKKITMSGVIGWDITADWLRKQLEDAKGGPVVVDIASPGGFVTDGIEIFNILRNYPGGVDTHLIGLAASMASYIAMAGKRITAEDNAVFMIHNVWVMAVGDYKAIAKTAAELEGWSNLLAQKYASRSGKSRKAIRDLMDQETYFFGKEMLDAGFVDEIIQTATPIEEGDGAVMVSTAKAMVKGCFEKMRVHEKAASDLERAAALLGVVKIVKGQAGKFDDNAEIVETAWDQAAADKRWREHAGAEDEPNAEYAAAFLWFDGEKADQFGSYKLQVKDYDSAVVVNINAVRNAAARLDQTDGPNADEKESIRAILDRYLEKHRQEQESGGTMTLEELKGLLAKTAGAIEALDAAIAESVRIASSNINEANAKILAAVKAQLGPDTVYPKEIQKMALEVLEGTTELASLRGAVGYFDAAKAAGETQAAIEETQTLPATPATHEQPAGVVPASAADITEAAKRLKAQ